MRRLRTECERIALEIAARSRKSKPAHPLPTRDAGVLYTVRNARAYLLALPHTANAATIGSAPGIAPRNAASGKSFALVGAPI
jgi:hypothetical protein